MNRKTLEVGGADGVLAANWRDTIEDRTRCKGNFIITRFLFFWRDAIF